jgi:hypothetical protein
MNAKNHKIIEAKQGLKYLGVILWPKGRTLNGRNLKRAHQRLNAGNISSYSGLVKKYAGHKQIKQFNWVVYEKLVADFYDDHKELDNILLI